MKTPPYLKEELQSSLVAYKGVFFEVKKDTVITSKNDLTTREYITHPGACAIIAINEKNEIILEYQYRHPVSLVMLEIPAGKIDPDELPLDCAKRELVEETGYIAKNWVALGMVMPCIGYSNEQIHYYLATELTHTQANPDPHEFLEITTMPISEFKELAFNGKIADGKTLSGLVLYLGYTHGAESITHDLRGRGLLEQSGKLIV